MVEAELGSQSHVPTSKKGSITFFSHTIGGLRKRFWHSESHALLSERCLEVGLAWNELAKNVVLLQPRSETEKEEKKRTDGDTPSEGYTNVPWRTLLNLATPLLQCLKVTRTMASDLHSLDRSLNLAADKRELA